MIKFSVLWSVFCDFQTLSLNGKIRYFSGSRIRILFLIHTGLAIGNPFKVFYFRFVRHDIHFNISFASRNPSIEIFKIKNFLKWNLKRKIRAPMHMIMIFPPSMLKKISSNVVLTQRERYFTFSRPHSISEVFHSLYHSYKSRDL